MSEPKQLTKYARYPNRHWLLLARRRAERKAEMARVTGQPVPTREADAPLALLGPGGEFVREVR